MKKAVMLSLCSVFLVGAAAVNAGNPNMDTFKKRHLEHADKQIKLIKQYQDCLSKAESFPEAKECSQIKTSKMKELGRSLKKK